MGIYERRDKPAYEGFHAEPHWCENPHIKEWWTSSHDDLLARRISQSHWVWYWYIVDDIVAATQPDVIEAWKKEDPLCSQYAWNSILMYFAASRAERLGLTKEIREPRWKNCPLCRNRFVEDSLPLPLVKRLGIDQLDFCAPCLSSTLLASGDDTLSEKKILAYLRDLASALQRPPRQGFGKGGKDLRGLGAQERLAVLRVLKRKPTPRRVKKLFGSWRKALVEAGVM